ncbi:SIMPL domain-containing protein [Azohydromonas sediminis]|uniref:SIMPL domain-containing protein n=1 Tax=Azohydromonas sediminis TaxID=2259674 RepID=UPI000E653D1F|nr:SIMPL domain-containing protein [Azohydromonas sediminis]
MPASTRVLLPGLLAALVATGAAAQTPPSAPPLQGVLNLTASASVEVPRDVLVLTFAATRDGAEPAAVQAELKRALDAALAEARKASQPGQIDVSTGNFTLFPRYAPKGGVAGWQGRAEMVVQGRDVDGIGRLAGRITTMSVAGVAQRLSREAQRRVEGEVVAQAIERFRAQAGDIARLFGYQGYALREVTVSTGSDGERPLPMMRAEAMAASADAPLPVEPGKGTVTATVSGSVQMK